MTLIFLTWNYHFFASKNILFLNLYNTDKNMNYLLSLSPFLKGFERKIPLDLYEKILDLIALDCIKLQTLKYQEFTVAFFYYYI
jgi:hypothetical protein